MKLRIERLETEEGECTTTDVDTEGEPCAVEVLPSGVLRLVTGQTAALIEDVQRTAMEMRKRPSIGPGLRRALVVPVSRKAAV